MPCKSTFLKMQMEPDISDPDSPDAQAAISSPLTLILAQNPEIVERFNCSVGHDRS